MIPGYTGLTGEYAELEQRVSVVVATRHPAVSLPQHGFLVGLCIDCSELSVKK